MKKLAALSLALVAGAASASGISVQIGTYLGTTDSSTTAADFQQIVTSDAALSAPMTAAVWSYDDLALPINDSALESTITFYVTPADSGTWSFRAGVDFGKGGALFLDGVALDSKNTDMWWNYSYADPTQFLAGQAVLSVGEHQLTLYGLETCCSGGEQTQFKIGNGSYTSFSSDDGLPAVPESQNYAMLLAGLGLVATLARRRRNV